MNLDFLQGKTILITGGTGSFGSNFVKYLLNNSAAKKIIIFSRDELKQFHLSQALGSDERLRFFLGDVRNLKRLQRAFHGVDIVIHAAALKQVPTLEYNPFEAVETNILGSQNVIDAAIDQGVKKVILISTDKAVQPVNLYGSTKLCAEKLFISGNSYAASRTIFSCVRYGNVIGSRGSIIETLLKNKNKNQVVITDPRMTRFWITLDQSFKLVLFALREMEGGEIFTPKIPSMKMADLFHALAPQAEKKIIGIRPGEKIHEVLISEEEVRHAVEFGDYYIILSVFPFFAANVYTKYFQSGVKLPDGFRYTSDTNQDWLTPEQLKKIIKL